LILGYVCQQYCFKYNVEKPDFGLEFLRLRETFPQHNIDLRKDTQRLAMQIVMQTGMQPESAKVRGASESK